MIVTAAFKQDNEAFTLRIEYNPAQEAERAEASDKIAGFWGTVRGIYVDPLLPSVCPNCKSKMMMEWWQKYR